MGGPGEKLWEGRVSMFLSLAIESGTSSRACVCPGPLSRLGCVPHGTCLYLQHLSQLNTGPTLSPWAPAVSGLPLLLTELSALTAPSFRSLS